MSIKALVKEHLNNHSLFDHSIMDHGNHVFLNKRDDECAEIIYNNDFLSIRKFSSCDLDECSVLFKEVFSSDPWYDRWVSLEQTQVYLRELVDNPIFEGFVALEDEDIIAVCLGHSKSWWSGKEFVVDEFFVSPEKQGNGMGTRLIDIVSKYLLEKDYARLILLTNKGIPAEDFYLKNGFFNNQKRTVMTKKL